MNPRSVSWGDGPPEDSLDYGPLYLTTTTWRRPKPPSYQVITSSPPRPCTDCPTSAWLRPFPPYLVFKASITLKLRATSTCCDIRPPRSCTTCPKSSWVCSPPSYSAYTCLTSAWLWRLPPCLTNHTRTTCPPRTHADYYKAPWQLSWSPISCLSCDARTLPELFAACPIIARSWPPHTLPPHSPCSRLRICPQPCIWTYSSPPP